MSMAMMISPRPHFDILFSDKKHTESFAGYFIGVASWLPRMTLAARNRHLAAGVLVQDRASPESTYSEIRRYSLWVPSNACTQTAHDHY